MRSRRIRSILILAALLAFGSGAAPAAALDILLTNDDGWDAVGIQAMKDALLAAGHDVTLVAPLENRSGSSAAVTLDLIPVVEQSPDEFSVVGTPATCVFLALTGLLDEPPDLIVSGTNDGANLGTTTPFSGTVGAATTGLLSGIPSIAFSTDPPTDDEADPAFEQHFEDVADFAVRLIAALEKGPGSLGKGGLLPDLTGLNVNYPPLAPEDVRGVELAVQGRVSTLSLVYIEAAPGLFVPSLGAAPDQPDVRRSDSVLFGEGFVTIVPIDGDYTASQKVRAKFQPLVKRLEP